MNRAIFKAFEKESRRHLGKIRETISGSFGHPDLSTLPPDQIEELRFRALKLNDAARIVSMENILELSEKIREIIADLSLPEKKDGVDAADAITSCITTIESLISAVNHDQNTSPMDAGSDLTPSEISQVLTPATKRVEGLDKADIHQKILAAFEGEYKEHLETIRGFLDTPFEDNHSINNAYRAAHSLKGAARAVDINMVEVLAHRLETIFSRMKAQTLTLDKKIQSLCRSVADAMEDYVILFLKGERPDSPKALIEALDNTLEIPEEKKTAPPGVKKLPPSLPIRAEQTLKVSAITLNQLQASLGQLSALSHREKAFTRKIRLFKQEIAAFAKENSRLIRQLHQHFPHFESDPSYAPLTRLTNWVSDQTRHFEKTGRKIYHTQRELHQNHKHLSEKIQEDLKHARMIPAQNAFEMFRKMIRDLAGDEKKEIDFKIEGFNLKADRLVFQQLKDPVMHLLRNALCHGVETPTDREQAGKSKTATIGLKIKVVKNSLNIKVSDDGRGLNHHEIAQTAVKKKLIREEEIAHLTPSQIMAFILRPGFSTTAVITDLSGRGMGLSVVKKAIESLQGDISVSSSPSNGTRFSLTVPLTILTHQVLLIQFKDQKISLPAANIDQLLRMKTDKVKTIEGTSVIYDGKTPIPFISMNELLSDHGPISVSDETLNIIILQADHQKLAVAVEAFLDEQEVLVKKLPPPFKGTPFQSGFDLADGTVCLILNPRELMLTYEKSHHKEAQFKVEEKSRPLPANRILIVDDSITTRTLEKTILEAHGYHVVTAVDGRQALNLLMKIDVDLVITDVDMPVMTGFELIREMKALDHLSDIPVIIVSSMEKTKDREAGLQLGADAYIIKQKFEQQNLLKTIKQIL